MKTIREALKSGKILVSDGAWGTFLHEKGLKAGECPELWNIDHPEEVYAIAKSYIDAGADMIETNSFGGSRIKLAGYGLADRAAELNEAAARISRKAAGTDKIVMGSIGPSGKLLIMGETTAEDLFEAYKEQAMALEKGGADAIIIETFSDLEEARIAVNAAKNHTQCEIICTMTFDKSPEGKFFTMMGVTPLDMMDLGADIIGANCGNGMESMVGIVKEIRQENGSIPILIHANAGIPEYVDGKTVFKESPDETAYLVPALMDAGVNIVGGCCGTTSEHIKAIIHRISNSNG